MFVNFYFGKVDNLLFRVGSATVFNLYFSLKIRDNTVSSIATMELQFKINTYMMIIIIIIIG